jgi:hypothetical protein
VFFKLTAKTLVFGQSGVDIMHTVDLGLWIHLLSSIAVQYHNVAKMHNILSTSHVEGIWDRLSTRYDDICFEFVFYVLLCTVVYCCVLLCTVVYCCVLLCPVVSCCVLLCPVVSCCVLLCTGVYTCVLLCTLAVYSYVLVCTRVYSCVSSQEYTSVVYSRVACIYVCILIVYCCFQVSSFESG